MDARDRGSGAPRGHGRAERTRRALISSALDLFADRGVQATAVEDITKAADVAKGTFYVYFHRKHDVLLEHAASLLDRMAPAPPRSSTAAALDALCESLATVLGQTSPAVRGPMVHEVTCQRQAWSRIAGEDRTLQGRLAPVIGRGQEFGQVRVDRPASEMARQLSALLLDATESWSEQPGEVSLVEALRSVTALFLQGAQGPASS